MSIVTHFLWFNRSLTRSLLMSMVVMVALVTGLSAADGTGTGLAGSYFPNESLSGTPTVTRTDAQVNFNWAGGAAAVGMPVDSFSVRWEGEIQPRYSELHKLIARTDDGVRMWLDGVLVVDAWKLRGAVDSTYVFTAVAGQHYRIRMEYYEHFGAAVAKLQWQSAHEAKAAIPTSQLYPLPTDMTGVGSGSGLLASYFANETLSGTPVLNRTDARVDVDWAGGSPASGVPVDSFSARWDGEIQPRFTETYTLIARTDDGVRVWLDNALVIDAWKLRGATDSVCTFTAQAGRRYRIRMEYFEHTGSASARLWWQSASEWRGPIATTQLYPTTISVIPTIAFVAPSASVSERIGSTTATILLSAAATQNVTIALQSSASDAQVPSTITILAGQTQAAVPVTILDDARYGADRSATLSLSDPVGALLVTQITQVMTIRNVDPKPTLTFTAPTSMNLENSGTASIPLRLSAPSSGVTQVTLSLSGSAISGSDYSAPGALFKIPADTLDATIFVPLLPDNLPEADEQIIITLSAPVGTDLGAITTHTITVSDGNQSPTIISGPTPAANPITTNAVSLSVQATDDGGLQALSYAWSVIGAAPAAVIFAPTTSATTTATFQAPGTYTIQVGVTDTYFVTATAQTTINVVSIPQLITVTPTTTTVSVRGTSTFTGHAVDQFGTALPITWSVSGGTIDTAGMFTAGDTAGGPFTVTATSGTASATATVTVTNNAPLVAVPATASPNPVTGTSAALSVLGSDDGGEMNLTYTWSTIGTPPAPVTFSANTSNAAKNTTATFTTSGSYTVQCTLTDVGHLTTTSNVTVVVTEASPVLSNTETSALVFTEGQAPAPLTATTVITQAQNTAFTQAVGQMTVNYQQGEDVLAFTPANGITSAWNASTGNLTLSGSASAALYQAALRAIVYQNSSESPSTLPRTVTFQVTSTSSLTSNLITRQITVAAVNDAPILAAIETTPLLVAVGAAATPVTSTITGSDVDNINLTQATLQIIGGYQNGADVLSFTNANGITGVWTSAAGTMTLNGTATLAQYQTALRTVKFKSTASSPPVESLTAASFSVKTSAAGALAAQSSTVGNRTVAFRAYDGTAWSTAVTRVVSVGNTVAPLITTHPASTTVTAGQTATFTVVASGTAPLTYQWKQGTTNVGINSATLNITNAQSANAGSYTCVVSNSAGTATSNAATLTVNSASTPPVDWSVDLNGSATIASYKTGSENELIDGFDVHYTNTTSQVTVSVTASSASNAIIDSITIQFGDLIETVTGASGSKSFTVNEGSYDLSLVVTAHNDTSSGNKWVDVKKRLVVDRTKPTIALLLPKRFWPAVADREAGVEEYPLVRRGLQLIWVNDMDEAWNTQLRKDFTMPVFGKSAMGAGLIIAVNEQSGLDNRIPTQAVIIKARNGRNVDVSMTVSLLDKSSTNEDKPEAGRASTDQRILVTGFALLPESYPKTPIIMPGYYRLRLTVKDKAGNESTDLEPLFIGIDTSLPQIKNVEPSRSLPFRFLGPLADENIALAWQGTLPNPQTMLRGGWYNNWDGNMHGEPSNFRLNQLITDPSPRTTYDTNAPVWGTATGNFIIADQAGNKATVSVQFYAGYVHGGASPYYLDIADYVHGYYDKGRTSSDKVTIAYNDYSGPELKTEVQILPTRSALFAMSANVYSGTWSQKIYPNWQANYDEKLSLERQYGCCNPYPLSSISWSRPLDPEPAANVTNQLLVQPAILTIAPSWIPKATLSPVQLAVVDKPAELVSSFGHISVAGSSDPDDNNNNNNNTYATLVGQGIQRAFKPTREYMQPGYSDLIYSYLSEPNISASVATAAFYQPETATVTASSLLAAPMTGNTEYANRAQFWLNAIKVSPDVVATGAITTIRIEAGFFNDLNRMDLFTRTGDFVRFLDGATDLTITAADYPGKTPEQLAGKIAIVAQRMLYPDGNLWNHQTLELDLRIDPAVAAKLYNIDVKLGAVKEYTDSLSQLSKGTNGAHRMKEALAVVKYEMLLVGADGSMTPVEVLPKSNPRPTVVVNEMTSSDVTLTGTSGTVRLRGVVRDGFSEIVKNSAADLHTISISSYGGYVTSAPLTRVDETVSTFRPYAHHFTFEALVTVPLSSAGNTIRLVTEANAFGNAGEAEVTIIMGQQAGLAAFQGMDFYIEPQPKGADPAVATSVLIWAGMGTPTVVGNLPRVVSTRTVFSGKWGAIDASMAMTSGITGGVSVPRTFNADLFIGGRPTADVSGQFAETRATSGIFHIRAPGQLLTAGDALVVTDVSIRNGRDAGAFAPFALRVTGPDEILAGEVGDIRGNKYPLEKKADGKYYYTGSDIRILVATDKTPAAGLTGTYLVLPTDKTLLDKSKIPYSMSQLTISDLIAGEKDAPVRISMFGQVDGNNPTFSFKAGDAFEIVSQPAMSIANIKVESVTEQGEFKRKVSRLTGSISEVKAPPGVYDVKFIPVGRPAILIPQALVVAKPTKIVFVNCYGHQGGVIDNNGVAQQTDSPEDPKLVAAGAALAKKLSEVGTNGVSYNVVKITIGTGKKRNPTTQALEDFPCDVPSWERLPEYISSLNVGGIPRIGLGTVVEVDTLGHGSLLYDELQANGKVPDTSWGVICLPNPRADEININTGNRLSIMVFDNKWPADVQINPDGSTVSPELRFINPLISCPKFADYFKKYLAIKQPVTINLYHCFVGVGGSATIPLRAERMPGDVPVTIPVPSGVKALANALHAAGSTNVTVIGGTGFSTFTATGATHGGREVQASSSTSP